MQLLGKNFWCSKVCARQDTQKCVSSSKWMLKNEKETKFLMF